MSANSTPLREESPRPSWEEDAARQEEAERESRLVVTWDEFLEEKYPKVPSLWGDAFLVKGGGYLIVGGDTGVGKTILMANLILSLAAGRDNFLGFRLPGRPVAVLFLEAEGSRSCFRARLLQMAGNLGVLDDAGLPIYFNHVKTPLTIAGDSLAAMIQKSGAELVFLDPVGQFYSGNENATDDWRDMVTKPLKTMSAMHNMAFALSEHYSKPNENRSGQHRIRGTAAKLQDCGAAMRLEVGRAGGCSRILFFDRVRDGALPFPDKSPSRMALEIDVAAGTIRRDEREDAEILAAFQEGRISDVVEVIRALGPEVSTANLVAAINERAGLERSRANDLIASAVANDAIERSRRGFYRLKGELLRGEA